MKSLLYIRLEMTRRSLRKRRDRKETNLPSLEVVLKDSQFLESPRRMKHVGNFQGRHLWNVGVVKGIIGINISPTKMTK
jgi:hypothetical protein